MNGFRLSIDYGTSNTVAILRWPDGRTRPLLFDSSPLLPSAVFAAADGRLLVGRDAERNSRIDPAAIEPNPKRCIADGTVLLGERSIPVTELISATLREVAAEVVRVAGGPPSDVVITYPAAWAALRRSVLTEAAVGAGLPQPRLVPEPVAAAAYFATSVGHRVGVGQVVVVYDLGGGTLDVSAVRRTPDGFEVVAVEGMPEFGGLDLDAAVVRLLSANVDPDTWTRLTNPSTDEERRQFRQLWDDARAAKEALSRQPNTSVLLPSVGRDLQVGREEFTGAIQEMLSRTAELTNTVIRESGGNLEQIAGLFLVGGSTRIPLVATTLHQATGIAPTVLEQPEIVVAEGALHATGPLADTATAALAPPAGYDQPPARFLGIPAKKNKLVGAVAGAVVLVLLIAGGIWMANRGGGGTGTGTGANPVVSPQDVADSNDGPMYSSQIDLCEKTDLGPLKDLAGIKTREPTKFGPQDSGSFSTTGCSFNMKKPGSAVLELFLVTVSAQVYATADGSTFMFESTKDGGDAPASGPVEGIGTAAAYNFRTMTSGSYVSGTYTMSVLSGNLYLYISVIATSNDARAHDDFDKPVAELAKQIVSVMPPA